MEIAGCGTSVGVPSHAFMDGTVQAADHKAQKQAGLHMTTDEVRAKELQCYNLMNNINSG